MVTNYYNASNNFSAPIRKEPKPFSPDRHIEPIIEECKEPLTKHVEEEPASACYSEHMPAFREPRALFKTDSDTLVLLALLWILFFSESRDRLLEIALIYLLLS